MKRVLSIIRLFVVALLTCVGSVGAAHAQSLDDQLFEDLAEPSTEEVESAEAVDREQFEAELRRELGGEDLGSRPTSPLADAVDTMRNIQKRLSAKDTAAKTRQMQQSLVTDFDKLIAALKKQNQQKDKSGGGKAKQQQKSPSPKPPSNSPKQSKAAPKKRSNQSAKQGDSKLQQVGAVETSTTTRDQLLQDSWGNLPAGTKQQMQSVRPEKFLPKYEQLIEEYFRRLAEEDE